MKIRGCRTSSSCLSRTVCHSTASNVAPIAEFDPGTSISIFRQLDIEAESSTWFGRPFDLLTEGAVGRGRNALPRDEVLSTPSLVYARQE